MAILQDDDWDPMTLHVTNQESVPERTIIGEGVLFTKGNQLIVDVSIDPRGVVDIYIEGTICVTAVLPGSYNATRLEGATLLTIHAVAHQKHISEPTTREEMVALAKLLVEAGAEEEQTS